MEAESHAMSPNAPEPSMQLLAEAAQNETRSLANEQSGASDQDDGSSSLSDLDERHGREDAENNDMFSHESGSEDGDEAEETEAETERLEESPQKQRQHKQVLLTGDSPARASAVVAGELDPIQPSTRVEMSSRTEHVDAEDEEDDEVADLAAQTSDMSSLPESAEASEIETNSSASSKKRKRKHEEDTERSLKKVALELANHVADQTDQLPHTGLLREGAVGQHLSTPGDPDASEDEGGESGPEEPADGEASAIPGRASRDAAESNDDEDVEMDDAENEADMTSAARSEEEMLKKRSAMDMLTTIEANFAVLRDKLFAARNQQLSDELATMHTENITHPEYLAMVDAIEQLRNDRLKQAQTLYNYKVQALRNRSIANRAQILSQFVQRARDLRETTLENIGEEWYQIQRGRRRLDEDGEPPLNHFTGKRTDHVARHTAYNTEVSVLSGVAKYVGFPAAPAVDGVVQSEIEDDLRQMEISMQSVHVPTPTPSASIHFGRQRPASEEQWSGPQPSWATNPQHPIHTINSVQHQHPAQIRPGSPFMTPAQKRASDVNVGSASTIAAFPSSSLAPTPLSVDALPKNTSSTMFGTTSDAAEVAETPSKPPMMGIKAAPMDAQDSAAEMPPANRYAATNGAHESKALSHHASEPADAAESRQHIKGTTPSHSHALVGSSGNQQGHAEKEFSPQSRIQASVELVNS